MQMTIRIPDEDEKKVARIGKKMGLKRSDIYRLAIKQFIEDNLKDDDRVPFEKVRHLLGVGESGIRDLGQHHREYLIKKVHKVG
jgi:hypothetical protein